LLLERAGGNEQRDQKVVVVEEEYLYGTTKTELTMHVGYT